MWSYGIGSREWEYRQNKDYFIVNDSGDKVVALYNYIHAYQDYILLISEIHNASSGLWSTEGTPFALGYLYEQNPQLDTIHLYKDKIVLLCETLEDGIRSSTTFLCMLKLHQLDSDYS